MAGYSPEHDVSGVSDPFLQVWKKVLFFCSLMRFVCRIVHLSLKDKGSKSEKFIKITTCVAFVVAEKQSNLIIQMDGGNAFKWMALYKMSEQF